MVKVQKTLTTPTAGVDVEDRKSYSLLVERLNDTATLEDRSVLSYKTKHILSYSSATMLLVIYPKRVENFHLHKNLKTDVYSIFFIIAKTWEQPRCPLVGEWTNKLWSTQTMNGSLPSADNVNPIFEI